MSEKTHAVEVVRLKIGPHPGADRMEIAYIFGFTCCVRKGDFKDGELAAYIQPDSIVDSTRPEFEFLKGHERVRVKKLRGQMSMGFVVKAPKGAKEGDDVAEALGVTHYEPAADKTCKQAGKGQTAPKPTFFVRNYDLESIYRYPELFIPGEEVIATEKIHGQQAKFVFDGRQMWAGSKNEWKAKPTGAIKVSSLRRFFKSLPLVGKLITIPQTVPNSNWWEAIKQNPWIEGWCEANPKTVLFGEIFGWVQPMRYGAKEGQLFFKVFDVGTPSGEFADAICLNDPERTWLAGKHTAPVVYRGPFDFEKLKAAAEGQSLVWPEGIREGIVVRPLKERDAARFGRVVLKIVSNGYLERDK